MNPVDVAQNLVFAAREYQNWPEAMKAILTRREFTTITLRNGFRIEGAHEFKWLMNQIFHRKVYTPTPRFRIGPDDVVVDVGANCGIFTMYAAATTRNTIFSIEPSPDNVRMLEANIAANRLANVVLLPVALTSEAGEAKLLLSSVSHQENLIHYDHLDPTQLIPQRLEEYDEITVPTMTLEQVIEEHRIERIDFLKMDCQGGEGPVLSSTPRRCLERIDRIALEYHDHISPLKHDELRDILVGAGFETLLREDGPSSSLGFLYAWRPRP